MNLFPWLSLYPSLGIALLLFLMACVLFYAGIPVLPWFGIGASLGMAAPLLFRVLLPLKHREVSFPPLPGLPPPHPQRVEGLKPQAVERREEERKQEYLQHAARILATLRSVLDAHAVILFLRSPHEEVLYPELVDSYEEELVLARTIPVREGLVGYAFRKAEPLFASEVEVPLSGITYYLEPRPVRCFLAAPLLREGICLGVLVADSLERQAFRERDLGILKLVSEELVRLSELNARYGEVSEELLMWQAFFEVAQSLHDTEHLGEVRHYFLNLIHRILAPHWVLFLEEGSKGIRILAASEEQKPLEGKVFSSEGGWISWALSQPGMREFSDLSQLPPGQFLLDPGHDIVPRKGTVLFLPLGRRSELPPSGILLYSKTPAAFRSYERGVLQRLLAPFELAYERLLAMEELRRLATTDPLTRLYNRRVGMEKLGEFYRQSQRTGQPLSLILLDVDRFKSINDTHGHDIGDRVLRIVAQVAQKTVRETDMVARFGGEEFLILLPATNLKGAQKLAERIRKRLASTPVPLPSGKTLRVTASFGVATFTPPSPLSQEALIKAADEALYQAKEKGRNRVEVAGREKG